MSRSSTAMPGSDGGASPNAKLKYVALLLLAVAAAGAYVSISQAGDADASRTSSLVAFAAGVIVGGFGGSYRMIKEGTRSDDELAAGTGGAVSEPVAIAIVVVLLPFLFFGDKLPEILERLVSGFLSGGLAAAAIGLLVLGRVWRKRGF